jgi:5-methylcytosine-specific restriction endonuclease McrA
VEKDRARRAANADEYNARGRERYRANPEAARRRTIKWRAENPEASRLVNLNHQAKRRALLRGAPEVERIDFAEVWRQSAGRCGLCHSKVSPQDGSLDHIQPLSMGGSHTYANVQLACRSCNFRKGARPMGEQLRLV